MSEVRITDRVGDWAKELKIGSKLFKAHAAELTGIQYEYPHKRSITLDLQQIAICGKWGLDECDRLITAPDEVENDVRDALAKLQYIKTEDREKVHIRFIHNFKRLKIRTLEAKHENQFISVDATIKKATQPCDMITSAVFRCRACGTLSRPYPQDLEGWYEPWENCLQCDKKTPRKLVKNKCEFTNFQRIKVQEALEDLNPGTQPYAIEGILTDDITTNLAVDVEGFAPGDRVIINGILRTRQRHKGGNPSSLFDRFIEVNSIERPNDNDEDDTTISAEDEELILQLSKSKTLKEDIINSIAPGIYGSADVKEAIALQLFGGVRKELPDGSHLRGDTHIFLVGDPGVAKSQMLRSAVKLSQRGIYASGKGVTSAGLTAAAVKDEDFGEGGWTLEAGVMPLADGGLAAIDEMDKMKGEDRSALHEAMEQQSISISKAGINRTLQTRTALIGAANPKHGRFDNFLSLAEQIDMPATLLSRFDLIFVMTDQPEQSKDAAIATHIIKTHEVGSRIASGIPLDDSKIGQPALDRQLLRKYILYSKRFVPIIDHSSDAGKMLINYYLAVRDLSGNQDKAVPITARSLEGLVRLSEASARMRLSRAVEVEDARNAIALVDICLRQIAYDPRSGALDIDRLESGISKPDRAALKDMEAAFETYDPVNHVIPERDLRDHMKNKGHASEQASRAIEALESQGRIRKQTRDRWKLIY